MRPLLSRQRHELKLIGRYRTLTVCRPGTIIMHVTLVHLHIQPEHLADFLDALQTNQAASIHEPGNLRFDVLQDPDDTSRITIYEVYASSEAALAHKQTPHFLAYQTQVTPWFSSPRSAKNMTALWLGPMV